jgi:hypothetical protein
MNKETKTTLKASWLGSVLFAGLRPDCSPMCLKQRDAFVHTWIPEALCGHYASNEYEQKHRQQDDKRHHHSECDTVSVIRKEAHRKQTKDVD